MFALARETGWSRDFILWGLSLDEALQYHHCALRAANCWTVPPMPDAAEQIARMEQFAAVDTEDEL
ncbi:MAG: hypothetical protein ACFUZC_16910 [Chthoniobacteraceae bacterium]